MSERDFTGKEYSKEQLALLASSFPFFRISVERRTPQIDSFQLLGEKARAVKSFDLEGRKLETMSTRDYGDVVEHYLTGPPESEHTYRRMRVGTPTILTLRPEISTTSHILNQINFHTKNKIREFMGEGYDSSNYSTGIWDKIKETKTDFAWINNLYGFDKDEFYNFLVPIRFLNEGVYWMDAFIEDKNFNDRQKILGAFRKKGQMYSEAARYMNNVGKKELVGSIPQIMFATDIHYALEAVSQVNDENEGLELKLKQMGPVYEENLEPSDEEYLDTGSYGNLYSNWFKLRDKRNFQILWNNSRRATDVIDGLIDYEDDKRNGVFCPLTVYVYNQCPSKEKEILLESFVKGTNGKLIEEILQKHSHDLLQRTKDYVSRISPEIKNIRMLKNRALEIIDFGIGMTNDLQGYSSKYNNFYNHSLD